MTELYGKRVLITGGAQGIGFEMAIKFAGRGAEIVLADIAADNVVRSASSLQSRGMKAWGFHADVTNPESIASLRGRIAAEVGPLDVLVNNAGVVYGGPFTKVSLEQHFRTYEVNVLGQVAVTHAFLDDLIARPEAHLVHIASASGLIGLPYGSTYASSKWAAIGFGESIRAELKLQGHTHVQHTIACPSYIGTGMFDGAEAPKTSRILDPGFLAEKVVDAVEQDTVYVLEPLIVRLTPILKALLPVRIYDQLSWLFGVDTSMARWAGRDPEPADHTDQATGSTAASGQTER